VVYLSNSKILVVACYRNSFVFRFSLEISVHEVYSFSRKTYKITMLIAKYILFFTIGLIKCVYYATLHAQSIFR
jgi:hypothetical protein